MGVPGLLILVSSPDSWMQPQATTLHLAPSPSRAGSYSPPPLFPLFAFCFSFPIYLFIYFVPSYEGYATP